MAARALAPLALLPLLPLAAAAGEADAGYDVIVVGGGHVGSGLAARAAELLPHRRVLLLEAGGPAHYELGGRSKPGWWANGTWQVWDVPETAQVDRYDVPGNYPVMQCWDDKCPESWGPAAVPRFQCKILGGCGVMNGALMQIPPARSFSTWPEGWKLEDMAPYLDEVQRLFHLTSTPSTDGRHYLDDVGADFVRSALEREGFNFSQSLTPRAGTFSVPKVASKHGKRQSMASVMLPRALKLKNFELRLHTEVLKVVHSGGRATGVQIRTEVSTTELIPLRRGGVVVMSAGALNTPRLLLASGLDGEGTVGDGLSDHTLHLRTYRLPPSMHVPANTLKPPGQRLLDQYLRDGSGPLAQYDPTLVAFFRDPDDVGSEQDFDVEMFLDPRTEQPDVVNANLVLMGPVCSRVRAGLRPDGSLGWDGDLHASCARDQKFLEFAGAQLDKIMKAKGATLDSKVQVDMNHFAGTCAIGKCSSPETLLVRGTANVMVADASMLPNQIIAHPAMLLKALALKAAQVVARNLAAAEAAEAEAVTIFT